MTDSHSSNVKLRDPKLVLPTLRGMHHVATRSGRTVTMDAKSLAEVIEYIEQLQGTADEVERLYNEYSRLSGELDAANQHARILTEQRDAFEPRGLLALVRTIRDICDEETGSVQYRGRAQSVLDEISAYERHSETKIPAEPPSAPLTPHGQALLDEAASLIRQIGRELDWGPGVKGETWRRINAFIQATPVPPETKSDVRDSVHPENVRDGAHPVETLGSPRATESKPPDVPVAQEARAGEAEELAAMGKRESNDG